MVRAQFSDRTSPLLSRRGEARRVYHYVNLLAGAEQKKSRGFVKLSSQCETSTSAGELRAEPRAFSFEKCAWLTTHSDLILSIHMRVLTLTVTPAHSNNILVYDHILYHLSHRRKSVIKTVPGGDIAPQAGRPYDDTWISLWS